MTNSITSHSYNICMPSRTCQSVACGCACRRLVPRLRADARGGGGSGTDHTRALARLVVAPVLVWRDVVGRVVGNANERTGTGNAGKFHKFLGVMLRKKI